MLEVYEGEWDEKADEEETACKAPRRTEPEPASQVQTSCQKLDGRVTHRDGCAARATASPEDEPRQKRNVLEPGKGMATPRATRAWVNDGLPARNPRNDDIEEATYEEPKSKNAGRWPKTQRIRHRRKGVEAFVSGGQTPHSPFKPTLRRWLRVAEPEAHFGNRGCSPTAARAWSHAQSLLLGTTLSPNSAGKLPQPHWPAGTKKTDSAATARVDGRTVRAFVGVRHRPHFEARGTSKADTPLRRSPSPGGSSHHVSPGSLARLGQATDKFRRFAAIICLRNPAKAGESDSGTRTA